MSDRALAEQYSTAENLRARIELHKRFSTSRLSYPRWVFDGYDFGNHAHVLEVGCGDGMIWLENLDRLPDGWRLTLTDLSDGMVRAARDALGDRASYQAARVEELPFPDGSFDAVIANHMLFHVEDRAQALSELRRVLRPGGRFVATTIGRGHLRQLRELAPPQGEIWTKTRERFTVETAVEELAPFFTDISIEPFEDSLEITDAEAVVAFIGSRGDASIERVEEVRAAVETAIARHGVFHVAKETARVRARRA